MPILPSKLKTFLIPQSSTKYLKLTLAFMLNSAVQETSIFQQIVASIKKVLTLRYNTGHKVFNPMKV